MLMATMGATTKRKSTEETVQEPPVAKVCAPSLPNRGRGMPTFFFLILRWNLRVLRDRLIEIFRMVP